MVQLARRFARQVVFVPELRLARSAALLTRGVDVWLNTPRRPLEACGTSGMKAAMNGVLTARSSTAGGPRRASTAINGWAIGDHLLEDEAGDAADAAALYALLEDESSHVLRDPRALAAPDARVDRGDASTRFSSDRMLRDYYGQLYRSPVPVETRRRRSASAS